MLAGFAFASNALFNFVVGLIVAKFLGPAEFGRYALAFAAAILVNTGGFDWIRLSTVRFYSNRTRADRPQVRATLDVCFTALTVIVGFCAVALSFSGISLALTPNLLLMAGATAVASGFFDYRTALARARFHNGAYARTLIVKNVMGLVLTVGGAWWFASAGIALAGVCLSVAGALISSWRTLRDEGAALAIAERGLAQQFLRYGAPLVSASILFQLIPLANRAIVSRLYGFGETGQFSLANDLGIRILVAIASTLDVLLFQLAVRAEETHGHQGARSQLADNMTVVFAIILPTSVGMWLILPSFEALVVPEAYRGPFAIYLQTLLPGLFCYTLMQYGVAPIFQIGKRTAPMIATALSACIADVILLAALPHGDNGYWLAQAQSGAQIVALIVGVALAMTTKPAWPKKLDVLSTLVATAAMVAVILPLRYHTPGIALIVAQAGLGALFYGAVAYALDIGGFRRRVETLVKSRA